VKLTKKVIDSAAYQGDADLNERYVLWDDELKGFGVRVYPTGLKSFVLNYRHNGRKRFMTIGQYGAITLDQARKEAKKYLVDVIQGDDPLQTRQDKRAGQTVKDLCAAYLERHAVNKKSIKDDERRIEAHILPLWRNLKASGIKRADVAALHSKTGKRNGIYEANRLLALLSKMFQLAELWGVVEEGSPNPASGIAKFKEEKRDRWVTPEELPFLLAAITMEPNLSARNAIWMYLLTGLRKEELLTAKWSDIDHARKEIKISDTKNGKAHYLPLSAAALECLRQVPRLEGNPYIITGKKEGRHLVNVSKAWGRIRAVAGIEDVRIHDLRRTVGSWLAQSGNSLHLIGRVLNHTNTSTTAIYARFGQDSVREALESHGQKIMGAAGLTEKAEVVPIKKKAAGGKHEI
jgi:integrase